MARRLCQRQNRQDGRPVEDHHYHLDIDLTYFDDDHYHLDDEMKIEH